MKKILRRYLKKTVEQDLVKRMVFVGGRFENFIASHLLKLCHFREDTEGFKMELRFLRDTDKREVDFVVLEDGKPLFAVERKTGAKSISPSIYSGYNGFWGVSNL